MVLEFGLEAMVKLIGILSWYDEPTWCLAELVSSVAAAGADAIIAVDGAYALFPNGKGASPAEQSQTIQAVAQGAGLEVMVHVPRDVWFGNEIEKRTHAFTLAHSVAVPEEDWLWILDGDEVVTEAIGLRDALEQTEFDTASIMMDEVLHEGRSGVVPMRKFFRAQESGIRVETNHFTFRTGDGQLLYEGFQTPTDELAECDHFGFVRIDHRNGRSERRELEAQTYYDRRKELRAELVPG